MAASIVLALPADGALAAAGDVTLVSHVPGSPTETASSASSPQAITPDGAFVVFTSLAGNLVPGQADGNGTADVFLLERATGVVTLVSHTPAGAGTTGNGASTFPSISDDGSVVVFSSQATNLVAGQSDANGNHDVFMFLRATGEVILVSHAPGSATATGNGYSTSHAQSLSADGRYVSFSSWATNLVTGQSDANGTEDAFLFDGVTRVVTLVSHIPSSATTTGDAHSCCGAISSDGNWVAFRSLATNLVPGQTDVNGLGDAFLMERSTGVITLMSHTPSSPTTTGNGRMDQVPSISANGVFVVFGSTATDLVAGQSDANGSYDVFVFERGSGLVRLVSRTPSSATTTGNGASGSPDDPPRIGTNATAVVFTSDATNLVAGQNDVNGQGDVFLFDQTLTVTLVSRAAGSATTTANNHSGAPSISADGARVAFVSRATNLVAGQNDANASTDAFLFQRATGATTLVSHVPASPTTTSMDHFESNFALISGDGRFVAFDSPAPDLVPGQLDYNDQLPDVFLFQVEGDVTPPPDFDGDGDTDVAVFRPAAGVWFVQGGPTVAWGANGDLPVPGDYDGDGDTDIAVFRPSTGTWFIQGGPALAWGTSGDVPVPGDYDGDGDTDIAVFRPSNGVWFIQGGPSVSWGAGGDAPLPLPSAIRQSFFP
jgi:Tol biopolymer transport system component